MRSIADSGAIRLARINVVVGRNSAGKSTLVRVLPLLRQSVERPTKGPLLWYGRFVDFGNYQNAVNSRNKAAGVQFEFKMNLQGVGRTSSDADSSFIIASLDAARFYKGLGGVTASLTVGSSDSDDVGKARNVRLDLGADQVEMNIGGDLVKSISINGEPVELSVRRRWMVQSGKILPIPVLVKEEQFEEEGSQRTYYTHEIRPFSERLVEAVAPLFHGNTNKEKVTEFAASLLYANHSAFYDQLKSHSASSPTYAYNVGLYDSTSPYIEKIRRSVLLASITSIFHRVDRELVDFASSVKYVEPIRATAERYYRLQDLAVDEIDSRGENAAMFLNSLSPYEVNSLKSWMIKHLGFYAEVDQGSGHVQVKIGTPGGESKNISDLGFGYSQLLPIILQLWRSLVARPFSVRRSDSRPVIAIEQPELHLHPQFQAQIADVLVAVQADKSQGDSSIFIETHSEHIVNRLGQLVAAKRIKKNDVQVLVVETSETGVSEVRAVAFDEYGFLDSNWPSGFFVPEAIR
ncbi:MAG: AAA family ATPase [Xanthomonadaceae bacterium]|nr:AAA family ATPase [Xanthomonadaceae bacterium]